LPIAMTEPTDADPPGDDAPDDHDSSVAVVDAPLTTDEEPAADGADPGDTGGVAAAPPPPPTWWQRAGRRIVRRPVEWAERPWPTSRVVQVVVTGLSLLVTTYVMLNVVHFTDLVWEDNTPTGGDMGAHVWGPAYLRDVLLPNWQLNGWSMDWYAGMPVYRFYMVVPALAIVALDVLLPYGVAFKLVAVSGLITLPFCCWAFGRLARFRYPLPELFAFAGMAFALDESFSIYGGNLKSTMAGEFSFSIALSLMVLGFGLLVRSMQTGRLRCWAAIVLSLAIVCHGIVAIYTTVGALVIVLVHLDSVKRFVHGALVGLAVVLLSLWWIGPFLGNHEFMTDMKYGARPEGANDSFWDMFFPLAAPLDFLITGFAIVGFVACVARRQLAGTALGITTLFTVALVYLTQDSLPVIGLLWNPRLLPYIYLLRYLLMMVGALEVASWIANAWRNRSAREEVGWIGGTVTAVGVGLAVLVVLGFVFEVLPGAGRRVFHDPSKPVYAWGPFRKSPDAGDAQGDGWSRYNFTGYEGRREYPEYHDVVQTMAELGRSEEHGCGRALWENNGDNGQYGTTMALMLLPHWTDGCIGSMEGLFFEASGTTPYHFLTAAAMSKQSSNPVRELRYDNNDAAKGVPYLQALGVRYVMVRTEEAKQEAAAQPELTLVAESGPWEIYEVAGSDVVEPLRVQPVVVEPRGGDRRERNLELGTSWFQHRDEWAAIPADGGPPEWQRITVAVDDARRVPDPSAEQPDTRGKQVDIVVPQQEIEVVELPEVTVSDVEINQQDLSFRVDRVGVPVLVKVSYFPNWTADGAEGPYRIAPNLMVVVPTEEDVTLRFERTTSDLVFALLTLLGVALLVVFRVRGDVDLPPLVGAAPAPLGPPAPPAAAVPVAAEDLVTAPGRPPDEPAPEPGVTHDDQATDSELTDGPTDRPLA
jgi:hypothetical protein